MKTGHLKYLLLFLFFLICRSIQSNSQNNLKRIQKENADSLLSRAERMINAGESSEALLLVQESLIQFQKIKEEKKVAKCLNMIGAIYYYLGNYSNALLYYSKSENAYESIKYTKGAASVLNNIGAVYYYLGNLPKALVSYSKAIKFLESIGDTVLVASSYLNIGGIYVKVNNLSNAELYLNKATSIYTKLKDTSGLDHSLNGLGMVYLRQNNFSKAYQNFKRSLFLARTQKDNRSELGIMLNMGELFDSLKDYKQSQLYYEQCYVLSKKISNKQYTALSQIEIGKIFLKNKEHKKAITNCKNGLIVANELKSVSAQKDACECLYEAYKYAGNRYLALEYYEKANLFKDSLQIEETSKQMMNMEFQNQVLLDSISYVKKEHAIQLKHKEEIQKKEKQRNIIVLSSCFLLAVAGVLWSSLRKVRKSRKALKIEKDRSEELLLNILPQEIAEELKEKGTVNARDFNLVTILFTDFKSFTQTAAQMSPQALVGEINVCFKAFDLISDKYHIEKIKTIGDSYLAAGGIPNPDEASVKNVVLAALEMQEFMQQRKTENELLKKPAFEMRLGIHAGPIVAGIVGVKKFQYDVWGDTVNTASRIESNGMAGKVNISETLYHLIKEEEVFKFYYRGDVHAKGKGLVKMYFVERAASTTIQVINAKEKQLM